MHRPQRGYATSAVQLLGAPWIPAAWFSRGAGATNFKGAAKEMPLRRRRWVVDRTCALVSMFGSNVATAIMPENQSVFRSEDRRGRGGRRWARGLPVSVPRYLVPVGTACRVSKLTPLLWCNHVTRRVLAFERHEGYRDGWYTFRRDGYLVRVRRRHVVRREDGYA